MLEAKDIRLFIVEDDLVQAEILRDKLIELNKGASVKVFSNGDELYQELAKGVGFSSYHFVILDYYLQNQEDKEVSNANEIVAELQKNYPEIQILLYSAYENDSGLQFDKLVEENNNLLAYVKKSDHGYMAIQNKLRFTYMGWKIRSKKKRLIRALLVFLTLLVLTAGFFFVSVLA